MIIKCLKTGGSTDINTTFWNGQRRWWVPYKKKSTVLTIREIPGITT